MSVLELDREIEELKERVQELESDRRFYVDACIYMAIWVMRLTRGRVDSLEVIRRVKEAVPEMQKYQRVQEYFQKETT